MDPLGGIVVALYVVYRWIELCKNQVEPRPSSAHLCRGQHAAIQENSSLFQEEFSALHRLVMTGLNCLSKVHSHHDNLGFASI